MLHEFLQLHPGLTIAIVGTLLMLNARFDYAVGFLKPVAALIWLIGGSLVGIAPFCWIWGWWLFLGLLRYPIALIAVATSIYSLFRFRPRSDNKQCGGREHPRRQQP